MSPMQAVDSHYHTLFFKHEHYECSKIERFFVITKIIPTIQTELEPKIRIRYSVHSSQWNIIHEKSVLFVWILFCLERKGTTSIACVCVYMWAHVAYTMLVCCCSPHISCRHHKWCQVISGENQILMYLSSIQTW